jgi:hypothetical protein
MTALVASFEMTAENSGPTDLDGMHDAALRDAQRSAVLLTIVVAVTAEYIRHFELWAIHRSAAQKYWGTAGVGSAATGRGSRSRGLVVEHTLVVAIRR